MKSLPGRSFGFVHWPRVAPEPWAGVWPLACGYKDGVRLTTNDTQDYYCIHVVTTGALRFRMPHGIDTCLRTGDMFAVFPYARFSYVNEFRDGKENGEMHWARLGGHLAHEYMTAMGFSLERPCFPARNPTRIAKSFNQLHAIRESSGSDRDPRAVELLYAMLPHADHTPSPPPESLPLALRAKAFMQNETERGLNIEQISSIFGVSRSTLFLRFKEAFGKSPVEVLIEIRVQRARRLLEETTLSTREVALQAGYSDPLYFSRQFTRHAGQSPTAYRAAHRP